MNKDYFTIRIRWRFGLLGYLMLWLYGWFLRMMVHSNMLDHHAAMDWYEPAIKAMILVDVV